MELGPQGLSDPPLLRRIRLHQSWYRAAELGLTRWGKTPPPSSREVGSILAAQDAAAGLNFESSAAREAYHQRRSQGWGVEPVRCESYMTSSQALTINLLGPLLDAPSRTPRFLRNLGVIDAEARTRSLAIERASARPSEHLNDHTIIDGYVEMDTERGSRVVAIETKLADPFSSRWLRIADRPQYKAANERFELWNPSAEAYGDRRIEQLARVHMLASSLGEMAATLLIVHHPIDTKTPLAAELYRSTLNQPSAVLTVTIEDAILALSDAGIPAEVVERLRTRYVDLDASRPYWDASDS